MAFKFSSSVDQFAKEDHQIADKVIGDLKKVYLDKSLLTMMSLSRGSVLIKRGNVLTTEEIECFYKKTIPTNHDREESQSTAEG